MVFELKQGDERDIPVSILVNGALLTPASCEMVEFFVGDNIRKVFPGEVTFNETLGKFLVPVTQDETFTLEAGDHVALDYRIKFSVGKVLGGKRYGEISVIPAKSREVL